MISKERERTHHIHPSARHAERVCFFFIFYARSSSPEMEKEPAAAAAAANNSALILSRESAKRDSRK
jgi:hypothetical protein